MHGLFRWVNTAAMDLGDEEYDEEVAEIAMAFTQTMATCLVRSHYLVYLCLGSVYIHCLFDLSSQAKKEKDK